MVELVQQPGAPIQRIFQVACFSLAVRARNEEESMSHSRRNWLLFFAAVIIVGIIMWSKVHIVIFVPLRIGGFILLTGGLILVIYLFLRMLFDGRR
jgi:hypothetical protein